MIYKPGGNFVNINIVMKKICGLQISATSDILAGTWTCAKTNIKQSFDESTFMLQFSVNNSNGKHFL